MLDKISSFLKKSFDRIKETNKRGRDWVGLDGLASMETSALLTIFLMLFFPLCWAMICSFVLVAGKCVFDVKRGSEHETHDFICAIVGVIAGAILGGVHAAVVLF